jgi:hypothetical protein
VTVVGHAATISAGEWITASGEWVNDRTHGQQFRAREKRTTVSSSSCAATPSLLMVVALQQTLFSSLVYGSGGTFSRLSPYQFVIVTHQRH